MAKKKVVSPTEEENRIRNTQEARIDNAVWCARAILQGRPAEYTLEQAAHDIMFLVDVFQELEVRKVPIADQVVSGGVALTAEFMSV